MFIDKVKEAFLLLAEARDEMDCENKWGENIQDAIETLYPIVKEKIE